MTTLTRWKLACALFAGIAGFATVSAHKAGPTNTPAASVTTLCFECKSAREQVEADDRPE